MEIKSKKVKNCNLVILQHINTKNYLQSHNLKYKSGSQQ